MGEIVADGPWAGFEVVYTYTREQAIADGVLIDLTSSFPEETRMFKWPVACTDTVWSRIENAAEADGTDPSVYVWDVCYMARLAIKSVRDDNTPHLLFTVMLPLREHGTEAKLKMVIGPTGPDDPSSCLTLMLPHED